MMTLSAAGFLVDVLSNGPTRHGLAGPARQRDVEDTAAAEDVAARINWPLGRLRAWRRDRIERRLRDEALSRLAELSPHLLDDIGMLPEAETEAAPPLHAGRVLRMPAPRPAQARPALNDGLAIAAE